MARWSVLSVGLLGACLATLTTPGSLGLGQARAQWGWGGNFSSTIGEGYQRGMADVIRSAGAANLMDSAAAQNYEAARSQALDNQLKTTETFFENRKMAKSYRDAERGPGLSQEQLYRMAKDAAPKRLSAGQFDPVTGSIEFPLVLQDPFFAQSNQELQKLFKQRAEGGALGLKALQQIDSVTKQVRADLAERIRMYPSAQYLEAQNFLRSLAFEAQFTSG
ncbi:MAG: hypothetical protein JNG90_12165 [Planctomycetaceae bacterium]|nr:hypothetical protein [Planctomycetaceae bacterium]